MSSLFDTHYSRLNPAQKQAVDTIEGPVVVIAGPGTGKTQVLALRIANILKTTQIEPENILALTFTDSGVNAMRQRLISIVGALAYRINIFTFHSFSSYIIAANPSYFEDIASFSLISELEQIEILEKIFTKNSFKFIKPLGDPSIYIKPAASAITELKRENINPEKLADTIETWQQDFLSHDDLYHEKGRYRGQMKGAYVKQQNEINKHKELAIVYQKYQKYLIKHKLYDYDDLILNVINKLESSDELKLILQEQYQYILVDEHQDTNRAQNRIIELLTAFHDNPNIFIVGDEKQAIYRFQGATLANFLYLKKLYPGARVISLDNNYRSTQTILDASHSLIEHSVLETDLDLPLRTKLKSNTKEKNKSISLVTLSDYHSEYNFIVEDIKNKIDSGIPPSEIVVLARRNSDLNELTNLLANSGIPYTLEAKQDILKDLSIQKLITLLKAVDSLTDEFITVSMYMDFFEIDPLDIILVTSLAKTQKLPIINTLSNLRVEQNKFKKINKLKQFSKNILTWHALAHNQTLDFVFTTILNDSGLLKHTLNTPKFDESLQKFITLYDQLRSKLEKEPNQNLTEFIEFLDLLKEHNLNIEIKLASSHKNAVRLMTAHAAKGLEFDQVYIVRAYNGLWGNGRNYGAGFKLPYNYLGITVEDPDTMDKNGDDRRLFYVALTRARKEITITYAGTHLDGKSQLASQFITEIDPVFIDSQDTKEFESWFSDTKQNILLPPVIAVDKNNDALKTKIREIFDEKGLSATALNNYLTCPWQYFFRNLILLPEAKSPALIFGTAIHYTINRFIESLKQKTFSESEVITTFSDFIKEKPLTKSELQTYLSKAADILPIFYQQKMTNWNEECKSELNITGVGLDPDIHLTGKIDMLEPLGGNNYKVVDFKTGKPKSRNEILGSTKNSNGDYHRQLVFYKLLMDRYLGGRMHMQEGVLEFVEPNDSGKLKSESFVVSPEQSEELENTIRTVAGEIRDLSFWDKRCDDPDCVYCRLRNMMGS